MMRKSFELILLPALRVYELMADKMDFLGPLQLASKLMRRGTMKVFGKDKVKVMVGKGVVLLPFFACALALCPSDFSFPGFFDPQNQKCLTVVPTNLIVVPWKGDWIRQADAICNNLFHRGSLAKYRFPVNLIDPEWSMLRKREPIALLDGCEINLNIKNVWLNGSDVSIFGNDLYRPCPDATGQIVHICVQ
ncbi:hypothetical protein TTRE_0000575901 [Trichuris trichiura]|uniref:Uncharacterized protein n=1 Tax=Trichuris trichiura TaxID=36087 RepID=A0A077ZAR3_TRITR|nr:hypothetical protein TTRE_0000575901 [Trichuris trichiura]